LLKIELQEAKKEVEMLKQQLAAKAQLSANDAQIAALIAENQPLKGKRTQP